MKIISWNINGFRAVLRKNALNQILDWSPDLLCLQEIKAKPEQIPDNERDLPGYFAFWNPAERPGYSGVLTYAKVNPDSITYGIQHENSDSEGRVIRTDFRDISIFNIYFPNGQRGQDRLDFKLDFYDHILTTSKKLQANGKEVIIGGDFNTAHTDIDLANPRENEMNSGFLPEERAKIDEYVEAGFVDIFRYKYPTDTRYTWWTYRFGARPRNIGWRIDFFMVTGNLIKRIKAVDILDRVEGSDHCPILLEYMD